MENHIWAWFECTQAHMEQQYVFPMGMYEHM